MTKNKHIKYTEYEPKYCWVGDTRKICYKTEDEAVLAARVSEYDYKIKQLEVYKCEFGDHWHLSSGIKTRQHN